MLNFMLFYLNYDGNDIKCPHCQKEFGIEWTTEYGDPCVGENSTECLECKKEFNFQTSIEYNSWK